MLSKILTAALFIASLAFGQTSNEATLMPFGPWLACGSVVPATSWMCIGSEQQIGNYQLTIHGSSSLATAYRYTIVATMPDGTTKTVVALVDRKDNPEGYTNIQPIPFGGPIASWQIRIDELATVGVTQHPRVTR